MIDEFSPEQGHALWRQAQAAAVTRPIAPVSALDLAAWIDGKADAGLAARVEAAVAADPVLLDMALAAMSGPTEIDHAASARLTVRARALVAPQIKPVARGGAVLSNWKSWRRRMEWAVVALALVVAAGTGVWIGGDVGDQVLTQTTITSLFEEDVGLGGLLSPTEDL
jgi:hypothetical protein